MNKRKPIIKPIFCLLTVCILLCAVQTSVFAELPSEVIPGGMTFGIKFHAKGAIVLGVCDVETASGLASPAREAGLQTGDVITAAGGSEVHSLEELLERVRSCGGKKLEICYLRNGESASVFVTPALDRALGEYRMGVWVRDSTAGIGTVTFIREDTKQFGGLGHGINDSSSGLLMPFGEGSVCDVTVTDVVKGKKSLPGELHGVFGTKTTGSLCANTEVGVFGNFDALPENASSPVPVASPDVLHTGEAKIRCAADGSVREYSVRIEEVYDRSGRTKNFLLRVTDPKLLEQTGGIVQGMSGSPVLQDGFLVGAVTHVLINDPTRGFGIRIENMLEESEAVSG